MTLFKRIFSALSMSAKPAIDPSQPHQMLTLEPGDLLVQKDEKGGWSATKILVVDPWPDGSSCAHCLMYERVPQKPTVESLAQASIRILHAPIDAGSYSQGYEKIGNQVPTQNELVGFVTYLQLTDFARYIEFTGQDATEIVHQANLHYQRANALCDEGKRAEAIDAYSQAIELFPLFYEAIDNRAFTYMELGDNRNALNDFEASLRVHPRSDSFLVPRRVFDEVRRA